MQNYSTMISAYLFLNLQNLNLNEIWSQQDGATCYTLHETVDLLETKFNDSMVSRNGAVNWLPRSCDITALDYLL